MNRSKIKSTLLEALKEAGKVLKSSLTQHHTIEKKTELSLVTETDKLAEKTVIDIIKRDFPDHALLTEESPPWGNSGSRWIIDPLDGTTNFAHTFPVACVSIAFEQDGQLKITGVYDPFRDELFFASRGEGATMNQKSIRISETPLLSDSLLCTGFPYDRRERPDQYLSIFKAFMMKVQGIRRTGSAALDLCYVACGRFDGFWEFQLQPWDKAAAMLIIEEAGGKISNFKGKELTLLDGQNLASNGKIHRELLEVLEPFKHLER
jgi:myo-inositol-1(or 4)-monophosphatase